MPFKVLKAHIKQTAICDNCEEATATVFCSADAANLCLRCDQQLHNTKLTSRHVRTPIGKVILAQFLFHDIRKLILKSRVRTYLAFVGITLKRPSSFTVPIVTFQFAYSAKWLEIIRMAIKPNTL